MGTQTLDKYRLVKRIPVKRMLKADPKVREYRQQARADALIQVVYATCTSFMSGQLHTHFKIRLIFPFDVSNSAANCEFFLHTKYLFHKSLILLGINFEIFLKIF